MKILLPLDGSELSEAAIPWLELLARAENSQVRLLRTYFPSEVLPEMSMQPWREAARQTHDAEVAREYVEAKKQQLSGLKVEADTVCGKPSEAILEAADQADLVLMASHGRGGFSRFLMGSVATKVMRACHRPLMVVGARSLEDARQPKLERILVPLDGSSTAELALPMAQRLARTHGSELLLFRCLVIAGLTVHSDEVERASRWELRAAQKYLQEVQDGLPDDIKTRTLVSDTAAPLGIVEALSHEQIDLVVMSSHGRSGFTRWLLGSVTESVLQRAGCPVLVVREPAAPDAS